MQALNRINKNVLIGAIIAAGGLCVSFASAQFQVEHSVRAEATPETAPKTAHEERVIMIQIADGEHSYEIKLVNGEVRVAKIDDKKVGEDRYKIYGTAFMFLGEDGEELHEITLPAASDGDSVHTSYAWSPEPGEHHRQAEKKEIRVIANDGQIHDAVTAYSLAPRQVAVDQTVVLRAEPKVMLGINLGEPSKVLRKHLKLKDGVHAILVEDVIDGLPADKAGLEDFDVIISIDGSDQADGKLLGEVLSEKEPGDQMKIIVLRSGEKVKLKIKLEAYDAKALGAQRVLVERSSSPMPSQGTFTLKVDSSAKNDSNIEFLIEQFKDGEFGNLQGADLEKLKDELHRAFSESNEQREKAYVIRAKAMDAMKDVERQIVEFRDGKLIVRANADLEHLKGRVHVAGEKLHHEAIAPHTQELDHRLAELEERLDDQMARMSDQMDRLADMFERLMDRLEDDD